ncbi:hybrid histidine kinase/receptor, partial [Acrasis kona]
VENKYLLIQAEIAAHLDDDSMMAIRLYEKSSSCAAQHKRIHERAMADELQGMYLMQSSERLASVCLQSAHDLYLQWGANRKSSIMNQQYHHIMSIAQQRGVESDSTSSSEHHVDSTKP